MLGNILVVNVGSESGAATPKKYCWDFLRKFDQSTDTFNNAMFVLCTPF